MKLVLCGVVALGAMGCGDSEPAPEPGAASTVTLDDHGGLPSAIHYVVRDGGSGIVRETVLVAHNLSEHCPDGCSEETLGQPTEGSEMRLLKLVFEGELEKGTFDQGSRFIQASIEVGEAGCGVPDRIGPDGEVIEAGHPPGFTRYESNGGKVTIGATGDAINAEVDVDFEIGRAAGKLVADHCSSLDKDIVE